MANPKIQKPIKKGIINVFFIILKFLNYLDKYSGNTIKNANKLSQHQIVNA